jgi:hypothetical protein
VISFIVDIGAVPCDAETGKVPTNKITVTMNKKLIFLYDPSFLIITRYG